jgi:hypothetical protein
MKGKAMPDRVISTVCRGWLTLLLLFVSVAGAQSNLTVDEPVQVFKNTLKWSTASELDNFGYDVYRSEHKNGPFTKLTKEPIAGAGTSDLPSYYEYTDTSIEPYKRYYYYIESISMNGKRNRFTPIREAPPKFPPTDASSTRKRPHMD